MFNIFSLLFSYSFSFLFFPLLILATKKKVEKKNYVEVSYLEMIERRKYPSSLSNYIGD